MAVSIDRAKRGTGSIRERLPGVWEIRVVVGFDPIHSRSVQRSFTVHGDKEAAEQRRRELVDDFGISRIAFASEASRLTVAELLERFFAAPHLWKPATVASHQTRHSSPGRRFAGSAPPGGSDTERCPSGDLSVAVDGTVRVDGVLSLAGPPLGSVVGGK